MDDGRTYESYDVAFYILGNEKWMSKMRSMNERDRFRKLCKIIPAACRDKKLKLTETEQTFVRRFVMRGLEELA